MYLLSNSLSRCLSPEPATCNLQTCKPSQKTTPPHSPRNATFAATKLIKKTMKAIWQQNTPYSQFLVSVGIILLSAVLFTVIGMVAGTAIYGLTMTELQSILGQNNTPQALSIFRLIQILFAFGAFVVPPFVIAYLFSEKPLEYLGLTKRSKAATYFLIAICMITITPLINFLGEVNSQMHLPGFLKGVEEWMRAAEDEAGKLTKMFLKIAASSV